MISVKKVLLVPADRLLQGYRTAATTSLTDRARRATARLLGRRRVVYSHELLYYADLPAILGPENVYVLGELQSEFHAREVPSRCPYPSFHGTPRGRTIGAEELAAAIDEVDVAIVSILATGRREAAVRAARKKGVPVALFDTPNHESNYGAEDPSAEVSYRFKHGRDYDLYFKNDLPLGLASDTIVPLAPCPVRPESYRFRVLPKDIDIFYSGRPRDDKNQADRAESVQLVKSGFPGAVILEHETSKTFLSNAEYYDRLSRSRIALCPSGRVWESWRYAETGLAPDTVVLAPAPYVETIGPPMKPDENAILYDVEFRDGRYHLAEPDELREKLRDYLGRPETLRRMAAVWSADVRAGHTVTARSRYIIDQIEHAF